MTKLFARLSLLFISICLVLPCTSPAFAEPAPEPNFTEDGVKYYLSAPDTLEIELSLYGEHSLTLKDGETVTIEWKTEVPQESLAAYNETVSTYNNILVNTPVPAVTPMPPYTWPLSNPIATTQTINFNRQMTVTTLNTLVIAYSKEAYLAGQQFLTGELIQTITAAERITSSHIVPIAYEYGLTEEVIQELSAGNFQSITPQNTMGISFPVVSQEVINRVIPNPEPPIPTRLDEMYAQLNLVAEHLQTIQLPPELLALIPEEIVPSNTATIITETEELITETEQIATEVEELSKSEGLAEIPTPNTPQIVAAAIASAMLAGVAGSIAAGSSGAVSTASSGLQSAAHGLMQGAATGAGHMAISFLKDLINGLRDMFVDEGRAHASGKVTRNLNKD